MICTSCSASVDVDVAELEEGDAKKFRSRLARDQRAKESPDARSAAAKAAASARWDKPGGAEVVGEPGKPVVERTRRRVASPVVERAAASVVERPAPVAAPAAGGDLVQPPNEPPAIAPPNDGCPRCGGRSLVCLTGRCECECHPTPKGKIR